MAAIKSLSLITYNVTSLWRRTRRTELEETLRSEKCNIGLIQETRLRETQKLVLNRKKVMKCVKGVGTAIVIDNSIRAAQISFEELTEFNFTAAEIKMNGQRTLVMSLYIPCKTTVEEAQNGLNKIGSLIAGYERFIIGGDLNARHPSWNNNEDKLTNSNGKQLARWLSNNRHVNLLSSEENTFSGKTKLDHFLVDEKTARKSSRPIAVDTANQHMLVKLVTGTDIQREKEEPIEVKDYSRANWKDFRHKTASSLGNLLLSDKLSGSIHDIDETIELATGLINKVVDETIPTVKINKGKTDPLPLEIINLMNRRKKAWRQKKKPCNNPAFKI